MSRLSTLSADAIRAMFSSETDEQLIMLVTITDPEDLANPIRLADGFTQRLTGSTTTTNTITGDTTDSEVIYGVVSNSLRYVFLPMQITLPTEQETGVGNCSIVFNYVTQEAIYLIRQHLTKPAEVNIQLILASDPNYIEASFPKFYITNATYNAESIQLQLEMISFSREPFPNFNFTPLYFPGLF